MSIDTASGIDCLALFLSCAIKNLRFLQEEMERELLNQQRTGLNLGPEHLLDCCDAMCTAFHELDRIKDELDATIDAVYAQKKEGRP